MGNNHKHVNILLHYGILHVMIISLFVFLVFKPILIWQFEEQFDGLRLTDYGRDLLVTIILTILIFIVYFKCLKNILYHDKTGRLYFVDRPKYHLTYSELVDYFHDADKHRIDKKTLPIEDWHSAEGIILGKIGERLVKRDSAGVGNLALVGRPGDGKTTCQIIPTALRFRGSILGFDAKGDITPQLKDKRKMKIFAPDDKSISCHFDPLAGIDKMDPTRRRSYIENMGFIILPDETGDNAAFFIEGARDFWCGISLFLLEKKPGITFIQIVHYIIRNSYQYWVDTVIKEKCEVAMDYIASYSQGNEKNYASQYNKLVKTLREFTNGDLPELLDNQGEVINPKTLEKGYDVWIVIPQDSIKLYRKITSILVSQFINYFMSRPDVSSGKKVRNILFLLDEFPQLHFQLDMLTSAMETLRSKRVSLFFAMQSLAQLERKYGDIATREIIDNCAYISCMSAQDPKSREYFSKLVGDHKVLKIGKSDSAQGSGSKSSSKNITPIWEPIYRPEDFGDLKDKIVIIANGNYIEADKCKCYE